MRKATFKVSDLEMQIGLNPTATREAWAAFGDRVKAAETAVRDLLLDPVVRGKGRGRAREIIRVLTAISIMKSFFDSQICCEFLDWQNSTRVFYGPVGASKNNTTKEVFR